MKKNIKILLISFIVLVVLSITFFCLNAFQKPEIINLSVDENYLDGSLSYPVFNIDVLDKAIKSTIVKNFDDFNISAKKEWEEHTKEIQLYDANRTAPQYFYHVSYEKPLENSKFVSILFKTEVFEGGAHGNTFLTSFTYDKKAKKLVDISEAADLSLGLISDYCYNYLVENLKYNASDEESRVQWISDGTAPVSDNYDVFTFDGSVLTVYFENYSVAPYYVGSSEVKIDIEDLKKK